MVEPPPSAPAEQSAPAAAAPTSKQQPAATATAATAAASGASPSSSSQPVPAAATSQSLAALSDPTLYLYTSLTAGSSHILTATSRLETILKANRIGFRAVDVATDERARSLWTRRARGKKLPGLVKYGSIVAVGRPSPPL